MNELPESLTVAKQLRETVLGQRITHAVANASPHGFAFYFGEPNLYGDLLRGHVIEDAVSHGMYTELLLDGAVCVALFDGVNIRYCAPGAKVPEKHQLLLTLSDGSSLVCTIQMYGGIWAFAAGAADDNPYYRAAQDKPSPLSEAFDKAYFTKIMDDAPANTTAKALLATQQRIPGLGNGVLQDILFNARIHPKRKLATMSQGERDALFHSVKDTLSNMTRLGGRDVEKTLFGQAGGYQTRLSNKTLAQPCLDCGSSLVRQPYLGGNIYFCPACQPLVKD